MQITASKPCIVYLPFTNPPGFFEKMENGWAVPTPKRRDAYMFPSKSSADRFMKRNAPLVYWELEEVGDRSSSRLLKILNEVKSEIERQDERFPWPREAGHMDFLSGDIDDRSKALTALMDCEAPGRHENETRPTWASILAEEVGEFAATSDPTNARAEAVQVAAVAVSIVQAIDEWGKK
jgi:hypothetical protein